MGGRFPEAVEFFKQMQNEVPEDMTMREERAEWGLRGWLQPQRSPG